MEAPWWQGGGGDNRGPGCRDPVPGVRGAAHGEAPMSAPRIRSDSRGYLFFYARGHPLAARGGRVYAHRAALYSRIGPGPGHECWWCGRSVAWWPAPGFAPLEADHLDGVITNNAPRNLVPACKPCNSGCAGGGPWRASLRRGEGVEKCGAEASATAASRRRKTQP